MYENLVFDIYGTLVDIHTDEQSIELWEKVSSLFSSYGVNYSPIRLRKAYVKGCKKQIIEGKKKFDYPEVDVIAIFKKLAKKKSVDISDDDARMIACQMRVYSREYIKLYDNVISTLKSLRERGKKLYILSNAQACFTSVEIQELGLVDLFDGIIFSSDYGVAKPSKTFFDIVIDKYHLQRSITIYIGNDALSDVNGARNAGIDCIWLKTNHTPKDVLPKASPEYVIEDGCFKKILDIVG